MASCPPDDWPFDGIQITKAPLVRAAYLKVETAHSFGETGMMESPGKLDELCSEVGRMLVVALHQVIDFFGKPDWQDVAFPRWDVWEIHLALEHLVKLHLRVVGTLLGSVCLLQGDRAVLRGGGLGCTFLCML